MIAERDLEPGEVGWAGQAWASVVADNFVGTVCGHCFRVPAEEGKPANSNTLPHTCETCGIANYCSAECMEAAKPLHCLECKSAAMVVQMSQGKSDTRGARMLINLLANKALEKSGGKAGSVSEDGTGEPWAGATYEDVQVKHRLCLVLPPLPWRRQRLCPVFPQPSRL